MKKALILLSLILPFVSLLGEESNAELPPALLDIQIPPPPANPPPVPSKEVQYLIVTSLLPTPVIGTGIGGRLSSIGYFLDVEIEEFSGTITDKEISGWIHFKNLGWAFLQKYEKYELVLVLNSPRMGWLYFPISGGCKSTFFSYTRNEWINYTKTGDFGWFYYYNSENGSWEILHF